MSDKKPLNKKVLIGCIAGVVITMSAIFAILIVVKNMRSATTMRLLRFDGEITLLTEGGKTLDASEDRRLTNGNLLKTKKESQAWILLDEDRVVTLMEKSTASFTQNGRKLYLSLEEGRLFFNIERSLEDDEDLNIATSTMIIGIRGTSGYIDSDENGNSVLYLTTGKVEVTGLNDSGNESDSDKIKAGQKVTVISDDDAELIIEDITEADLPYELLAFILSDEDLLESILEETGWDEDLLRMSLSSEDEDADPNAVSDADDPGNTFDLNELTGTWYGDGQQFISINGDGTGTLFYPSDGMFGSPAGSLIPITMTYEVSQDYMVFTDPVHYSSGLMCDYFYYNGELVLYDMINDRILVKDNAFDTSNLSINSPDFIPVQVAVTTTGDADDEPTEIPSFIGLWEDPYTYVQIDIRDDGTGLILGAANPEFTWWVEGNTIVFSNEYIKYENGVLLRGAISADGVVWTEMRKIG